MAMTIKGICATIKVNENETTSKETTFGNRIYRAFFQRERYVVDFAPDFHEDGWEQYDTDQDASYFGIWINKKKLCQLCYAEGDWSLVECMDAAGFNREIENMNNFYRNGYICTSKSRNASKVFDENGKTTFIQDRQEFFIK